MEKYEQAIVYCDETRGRRSKAVRFSPISCGWCDVRQFRTLDQLVLLLIRLTGHDEGGIFTPRALAPSTGAVARAPAGSPEKRDINKTLVKIKNRPLLSSYQLQN